MCGARIMFCFMLMMMIEGVWMNVVMGVVYNVGDSAGWTTLVVSNYSTWASSKKFHVGDILLFHYNPANHNVMRVNRVGFRSCNITTPVRTYQSGNDSFTVRAPGHYYFICSFPGHCDAGQKLDVKVFKKYSLTAIPRPSGSSSTALAAVAPPKATTTAPRSVARPATGPICLFRSIVFVSISCIAMWVA